MFGIDDFYIYDFVVDFFKLCVMINCYDWCMCFFIVVLDYKNIGAFVFYFLFEMGYCRVMNIMCLCWYIMELWFVGIKEVWER